jgi:hypothetical protein
VDQLVDALAQGERRGGDEHAQGRDQRPEVGFPPVPQGMLVVGRAAAATLGNKQEHVVGGIGERFGRSGTAGAPEIRGIRLLAQDPGHGVPPVLHAAVAGIPGHSFAGPSHLAHMRGAPELTGRSAAAQDPDLARRL